MNNHDAIASRNIEESSLLHQIAKIYFIRVERTENSITALSGNLKTSIQF